MPTMQRGERGDYTVWSAADRSLRCLKISWLLLQEGDPILGSPEKEKININGSSHLHLVCSSVLQV